jgi:hypothetical protein
MSNNIARGFYEHRSHLVETYGHEPVNSSQPSTSAIEQPVRRSARIAARDAARNAESQRAAQPLTIKRASGTFTLPINHEALRTQGSLGSEGAYFRSESTSGAPSFNASRDRVHGDLARPLEQQGPYLERLLQRDAQRVQLANKILEQTRERAAFQGLPRHVRDELKLSHDMQLVDLRKAHLQERADLYQRQNRDSMMEQHGEQSEYFELPPAYPRHTVQSTHNVQQPQQSSIRGWNPPGPDQAESSKMGAARNAANR